MKITKYCVNKYKCMPQARTLCADDDVVDGDVDELHEEANEAHDEKAYSSRGSNAREFALIRLCALAKKVVAVLREEL